MRTTYLCMLPLLAIALLFAASPSGANCPHTEVSNDAPELEAKALFEHLQELRPERYQDGHLRTFQRRVKRWRATRGPEKEIFFPQAHRPGEAFQTDFTHAAELGITIAGEFYDHLLCVTTLPYSIWRWATPCQSESMLALSEGLQNAASELGFLPEFHQTDHSTAATHIKAGEWIYNDEYQGLMRHLGTTPRLTGVGKKEQNGSVEASNGVLKRRLTQELLLRGSRNFESEAAYAAWLEVVLRKRNRARQERLDAELAVMRPLKPVPVMIRRASTARGANMQYFVRQRATENGDIVIETPAIDVEGQALLVTEVIVYNLAGSAPDIAIQLQSSNDMTTFTDTPAAGTVNRATAGATPFGSPASTALYGRYVRYQIVISGTVTAIQYSLVLNTFASS